MPQVQLLTSLPSGIGDLHASPPASLWGNNNTNATLSITPVSGVRTVRLYQHLSGIWVAVQGGSIDVDAGASTTISSVTVSLNSSATAVCALSVSGSGSVTVNLDLGWGAHVSGGNASGGGTSGVFTSRDVTSYPATAAAWEALTCKAPGGLVDLPSSPTAGQEVNIFAKVAGVTFSGGAYPFVWADPYEMSVEDSIGVIFDGSNWIPTS